MEDVDKLLNSMIVDMKAYKIKYEELSLESNKLLKEYNDKIEELQKERLRLQQEGNKKLEVLDAQREQLSGKYIGLYEQYKKFTGEEPDLSEDSKKEIVDGKSEKKSSKSAVASQTKTTKSVKNVKKEETKEEIKEGVLSPEDIAKLSEITNNSTPEKLNVDKNGNEIPEYLQDSYVK